MTDEQIKYMRDRFLNWELPKTLNPDGGITFKRSESAIKYNHPWPVGTNFLNAEEAEALVRHMIEGLPCHPALTREDAERMDGVGLIAAERQRQIEKEGWTPEHDDEHDSYELSSAACCYAQVGDGGPFTHPRQGVPPTEWPWAETWWKPSADPIRNLVKAGALIAAEIDRLRRAAIKGEKKCSGHKTRPVQVIVDVDEGIAAWVEFLQTISGIRTHASCQGTIESGRKTAYKPYVEVTWQSSTQLEVLHAHGTVEILGDSWGRFTPAAEHPPQVGSGQQIVFTDEIDRLTKELAEAQQARERHIDAACLKYAEPFVKDIEQVTAELDAANALLRRAQDLANRIMLRGHYDTCGHALSEQYECSCPFADAVTVHAAITAHLETK